MACCISSASITWRRRGRAGWRRWSGACWRGSASPIPTGCGRTSVADAAEGRQPPDEGPFQGLLNWLRQLRGGREGEQTLREELEELIEEHADETPIDPHERRLLV